MALMGILLSEYQRGMEEPWVDVRPGHLNLTVSPAALVSYEGRGGGGGRERGARAWCQLLLTHSPPPCL